jgi:Leucine Rich repeat
MYKCPDLLTLSDQSETATTHEWMKRHDHRQSCSSQDYLMPRRRRRAKAPPIEPPAATSTSSSLARRYIREEEYLDLRWKNIGAQDAKQIAHELVAHTTLAHMHLNDNKIGNDGVVALAGVLATNKSLTRLWLNKNGIGDVGMEASGQALMQNDSLESLNVGDNEFGMVGLTSFACGLKINKGLTDLCLYKNSIGNAGAIAMADALTSNTSLTRLHLWGNNVGNEGAAALGEALKTNATLTELWLDINRIGNEGAEMLLNALKQCNTSLTALYLFRNNVSLTISSAIEEIVNANEAGVRLIHAEAELDLSSKGISGAQAKLVSADLASSATVTTLNLNQNRIDQQGVDIANALTKNRVLTSIELNDNLIGCAGCSKYSADKDHIEWQWNWAVRRHGSRQDVAS